MRAPPLDVVESNCRFELRAALASVVSAGWDVYALSATCDWFRMLATCRLFRTGLPEEFTSYIRHGPGALLHYAAHGTGSLTATRVLPLLFDAIAAGDWPLAVEVAALVPTERDVRTEYEDDFAYARTLAVATVEWAKDARTEPSPQLAALVEASDEVLGDPRRALVAALAEREAASFDSALTQLLEDRETSFTERLAADDVRFEVAATTERLCVEGLALVALARRRGLETKLDYLQVPSLAMPREDRADPDRLGWQSVAQA